jgi:hypothetical protein
MSKEEYGCGCSFGLGSLIAALLSWDLNHDILWLIFHIVCGWFYVIYRFFVWLF